jgi:sentrin-specific protease 7
MDKVFAAHASDFAGVSDQTRASLHDRTGGSIPTKANRRLKLADQLRDADGVIVDAKLSKSKRRRKAMMGSEDGTVESRDTSPVQARRQRSPPYAKPFKSILKDQGDQPPESDADAGPEIPVKPLGPTTRETRSSRRAPGRHSRMNEDGLHDTDQKSPLEDDAFRENWKKPLVYPPNGAKKAEVNLDDRDRLREDTFLNDNLIAFYMRFLQDHLERTNKDAARRIYFFNSYFFATLTNPPRGKRDINYKGVEKWTRSVDLFSYDYILVPINEHHHWYIAIICNLPSLSFENAEPVESVQPSRASSPTKQPAPIPETKVQEIDETPEPELKPESNKTFERSPENNVEQSSKPPKEPETRRRLASLSIEEKELAEKYTKNPEGKEQPSSDEGQDADENPTSSPANLSKISAQKLAQDEAAASQPIGKSRKKRSGQKLHPNQPTIITFDSLDVSRSPTIRILREYISLEAISKRGLEINTSEIKGMRGQGIPSQPNWSDCGLYLLAYVEKFIQSPDWFITKVLQRSMDSENDWPRLRSGELRIRLRTFLDELYEEQSQTSRDPKKRIMADRSPIDFLLRPPRPHQEDDADIDVVPESQHEPQKETEVPPTIPTKESTPVDSAACKVPDEQSEDSTVDQMHMVPTESPPAPKPKAPKTRTEKPQTDRSSHAKNEPVIQVPCSQEEPEVSIPRTPPPAEAQRKRKSPRGPRKG